MPSLLMTLWILTMILGGLGLLMVGAVRFLKPGEVPRLRRSRPMAFIAVGMLFLSMPAIHRAATQPPQFTMTPSTAF